MQRTTTIWLLFVLSISTSRVAWSGSLQEVLNRGSLRVGVALSTPWAMRSDDRELLGFEIDVANNLASDMKVEADIRVYEWERLILALESGEIDIIAAGLVITPDRALHVNFSQPYASGGISLATNLERTANVQRLDDLNNTEYKVAVVRESVAFELAQRILSRAELVVFDDAQSASGALIDGQVDGYLEDEPVPTFLALENPGTLDVPVAKPLLETQAAFAVNKGDPDFIFFLDAWIIARQSDTWLPTRHNYWFDSLRWRNRLGIAPER